MVNEMTDFNPIILVITLNVNSLTISVKKTKLTNHIQKQDLMIGCLQEISFKNKDRQNEKRYTLQTLIKRVEVTLSISDKVDF